MATRTKSEVEAAIEASRREIIQKQKELADLEEQVEQKTGDIKAAEAQLGELEHELESAG
jgi:predicted nuclease with TOPRIM domain